MQGTAFVSEHKHSLTSQRQNSEPTSNNMRLANVCLSRKKSLNALLRNMALFSRDSK